MSVDFGKLTQFIWRRNGIILLKWFYVVLLLLDDLAVNAQVRSGQSKPDGQATVVDLTRAIVSGYDGAKVDYDDFSGVIDRLTLNVTTSTHALIPSKRLLRGRHREPISSLCGLPATVLFIRDTLELSDIHAYEDAVGQQLPYKGAVIVIFPSPGSSAAFTNLKMQEPMLRSASSGGTSAFLQPSSQAASVAATGVVQTMAIMRSRDVISRDAVRYLTSNRSISIFATNAHYLDHVGKHANTLERLFLRRQVILIRNIATPGISASKWLQNGIAYGNNLNAFAFIYEPHSKRFPSLRAKQQKALSPMLMTSARVPHGGRLALAGLVLSAPRLNLACLSLSNLNARTVQSRVYRPIQTGFATEVEVALKLRSPQHTYLSTPSSHQFLTASIPDELKFGTCAKMPILVTRGVSSVVSVSNLIAWENERRRGVTGAAEGSWTIDDQMILFQVISVGEDTPGDDMSGMSSTKLFIEPEVFAWLRRSRNVRIFGFDYKLNAILGNKHEVDSVLAQLDDTVTIYNVFNLENIRTSRTFTYNGLRNKRANMTAWSMPPSGAKSGCNQFQCAFVNLRLWPASLAPVQLYAVTERNKYPTGGAEKSGRYHSTGRSHAASTSSSKSSFASPTLFYIFSLIPIGVYSIQFCL